MNFFKNFIESYEHIPYTLKHIWVMYKLQLKYIGYIKFPFHDFDKLFMYIFLGFIETKKISKIHRKYAKHHLSLNKKFTFDNILEAVLDWESARFTKPDKPLNAWNTCIQYYPEWKLYVEDILVKYKIPK